MAFFMSRLIFHLPPVFQIYMDDAIHCFKTTSKGVQKPKLFLPQSAERPPPMGVSPPGCPGGIESRFLPKNKHFFRPPKGGEIMAIFRIEKTCDYTVMSNHHLRNAGLSLKFKGLLSLILSLPEASARSLAKICKKGTNSISSALKERTCAKYIAHSCLQDSSARLMRGIILICDSKCSFRCPPVSVRRMPLISAAPLRWS